MEGSSRRNLSVISVSDGVGDSLKKKSRPSFEGWVSAKRRDETWWRTGVVDSGTMGVDSVTSSEVEA